MGKDHVGDVPLSKKILAALTTGEKIFSFNFPKGKASSFGLRFRLTSY